MTGSVIVSGVAVAGVGAILLTTGILKLQAPTVFARSVNVVLRDRVSPRRSRSLARSLAVTEVVLGIACLVAPFPFFAVAIGVAGLAFVVLGTLGQRSGMVDHCGCFGNLPSFRLGWASIAVGAGCLSLAAVLAHPASGAHTMSSFPHELRWSVGLLGVCSLAAIVTVHVWSDARQKARVLG